MIRRVGCPIPHKWLSVDGYNIKRLSVVQSLRFGKEIYVSYLKRTHQIITSQADLRNTRLYLMKEKENLRHEDHKYANDDEHDQPCPRSSSSSLPLLPSPSSISSFHSHTEIKWEVWPIFTKCATVHFWASYQLLRDKHHNTNNHTSTTLHPENFFINTVRKFSLWKASRNTTGWKQVEWLDGPDKRKLGFGFSSLQSLNLLL